jgi:hypothetical protein
MSSWKDEDEKRAADLRISLVFASKQGSKPQCDASVRWKTRPLIANANSRFAVLLGHFHGIEEFLDRPFKVVEVRLIEAVDRAGLRYSDVSVRVQEFAIVRIQCKAVDAGTQRQDQDSCGSMGKEGKQHTATAGVRTRRKNAKHAHTHKGTDNERERKTTYEYKQ